MEGFGVVGKWNGVKNEQGMRTLILVGWQNVEMVWIKVLNWEFN